MDTKTRPVYMLSTKTHFRPRDTYSLKLRGWKKIFHASGNKKKARVTILITDQIHLKIKTITKDKVIIKRSSQEEDIQM